MNVEIKVSGRLIDDDGNTVSKLDLKETGAAKMASVLGRDVGQAVGAALEKIAKKGE